MIPLIELCNHEENTPSICLDYDVDNETANCYTQRHVNKGDQVRIIQYND